MTGNVSEEDGRVYLYGYKEVGQYSSIAGSISSRVNCRKRRGNAFESGTSYPRRRGTLATLGVYAKERGENSAGHGKVRSSMLV
jgi:hypothetical protein